MKLTEFTNAVDAGSTAVKNGDISLNQIIVLEEYQEFQLQQIE
jgi:hypothetical protein